MTQEPVLTDAELVVLSLFCEQPLHGYQIEQLITDRNMRVWTDLSTSSIYYLLNKLENKGWIEPAPSQSNPRGAPRKVYRITPSGEEVWKTATLDALARPRITYTNFLMGLHNLWKISAAEARDAVLEYRDWLKADLKRQHDELDALKDLGLSRFPVDELFKYGFSLGDAELDFLEKLIQRLGNIDKENS